MNVHGNCHLLTILIKIRCLLLFVNTHVRIKIYREFYHGIIHIANEGRYVRIKKQFIEAIVCIQF
jgi:hypothetical protein